MIKEILRKIIFRFEYLSALLLMNILRLFFQERVTSSALIIAPPGGGNIGDIALVEATISNLSKKYDNITLVTTASNSFEINYPNVSTLVLPSLIYGSTSGFLIDLTRIGKQLPTSLYVIGADIMDGAYNLKASTRRSLISCIALHSGVKHVRVLGFSISEKVDKICEYWLKKCDRKGVKLCLRDPISYSRAQKLGLHSACQTADVVFAWKDFVPAKEVAEQREISLSLGEKLAIVNVSGLIFQRSGIAPLLRISESLIENGYKILFLPHVIRDGANDLPLCKDIHGHLAKEFPDKVYLVERLLTPSEVKKLCEGSKIVITGRMHLAIIAALSGAIPFVFDTQGKVEGLLQLLGLRKNMLTSQNEPLWNSLILQYNYSNENRSVDLVKKLAEENFA